MNGLRNFQAYVLACSLVVIWQPLQGLAQSDPGAPVAASVRQQGAAQRDGQHDFDFEIGTWKTHLSRRLHPLTGSTTWVEYDGTSVVRKIWGGRANLVELDVTGPAGHVEALSLRLYDPVTHQWSLNSANVRVGTLSVPTIGEFKNGRGEFYDQEPFNGRTILVRNVWSEITADSCHFEQAFSEDGGKSWEVNWIAVDKRVKDDSGEAAPDTTPGAALGGAPAGAQQNSALFAGGPRGAWRCVVDRADAGEFGGDVAAGTFSGRAIFVRCDRSTFERVRVADVHRVRTLQPIYGGVDPDGGVQQDERRAEQLEGRARRSERAGAIPAAAIS